MHIKRFEARDLKTALAEIRAELGPDALILESRKSTEPGGGVLVLAAHPHNEPAGAAPALLARTVENARVAARAVEPARSMAAARGVEPTRGDFEERRTRGAAILEAQDPAVRAEYLARLVRSDHFSAIPLPLRELYLELVDAEVDSHLVFQILQRMGNAPLPGQFTAAPPDAVLSFLRTLVTTGGTISIDSPRRVIALVGPTGVGKTTTAAKIAGQAAFRLGRRVALVSCDAYRVFGAQHLASYAALMGLPFETVTSGLELKALLSGRLREMDLVLIDTSGRSPRDPEGIREIHELLAGEPELEVQLVLAANGRVKDLGLAVDSFGLLPLRGLVFTKLDETTTRGGIYSTALKARRPVSYLATGQEVPDDLVPATPEALTRGLFRDALLHPEASDV